MILRRLVCLLLMLCPVLVLAQDESEKVITAQNAEQLTELSHIGGAEPGRLAWSPDGTMLAVGTSAETRIYALSDLTNPVTISLPGTERLEFLSDEIVWIPRSGAVTDQPTRFNIMTGEPAETPPVSGRRNLTTDPRFEVKLVSDESASSVTVHQLSGANPDLEIPLEPEQVVKSIKFNRTGTLVALDLELDTTNIPDSEISFANNALNEIRVRDLATGDLIMRFQAGYADFRTLRFSNDNASLLIESSYYSDGYSSTRFDLVSIKDVKIIGQWLSADSSGSAHSADGRWLAFYDNYVRLWDGQQIISLVEADFQGESRTAYVSFTSDSQKLTAVTGGIVYIWDLKPGLTLEDAWQIPLEDPQSTSYPIFSPDQSLVAIGNQIWNTTTRKQVKTLGTMLTPSRFSPDNRLLLMRSSGYYGYFGNSEIIPETYEVWDLTTGQAIFNQTGTVAVNNDLTYGAYWQEGQVIIHEIGTGSETALDILGNSVGTLYGINPEGTHVIFQQNDAYQVFDLVTGETGGSFPLTEERQALAFIAKTPVFAVRPVDDRGIPSNQVSFYETAKHDVLLSQIELPDDYEYRYMVSPDGKFYQVEQLYGGAIRYNTWTGAVEWSLPYSGTLSPNTDLLVKTSFPESWVELYDTATVKVPGQIVDSAPLVEPMLYFELPMRVAYPGNLHFTFSPTGQYLIIDGFEAVVQDGEYLGETSRSFIVETDQIMAGKLPNPFPEIRGYGWNVIFSPDESLVISQQYGGRGHYVFTADGQELAMLPETIAVAFNSDGTLLAFGRRDQVSLYSVENMVNGEVNPLVNLPVADILPAKLLFSPDGKRLIWHDAAGISVWGLPD